uniref:Uncharacterized protein n=1 Tax=Timema shepardi TaxID=629360 RepID=A0A7R9B425_TIMSH|nr:unnamed protein product [Timema shepardi]
MTSDEPSLKAIECFSFPNLLSTISVDTIVQSTEEMCKTFIVPGLSGELENTTSTSSSSLAHRLENFKDDFKQKGNNLTSINNTKLDFTEPLDFSSKSNKAIDYLIKPSIKKNPMATALSEHSQNGRYNLADESVPWPNTSGISKMHDSLISSGSCSITFTQCYGDPKEQLPQDTSKGAIKKVNTKPKIDSHKDELFTSKLDSKPVRDLTTLSKIPVPKSSALAIGKVSRIPLRTNGQLDKLRPRNPLQISNANVNQKIQPLRPVKPKIQFGSSGTPNLMIFKAKPTQEPFKRGGNVGFGLGRNMAEGSYGNNTKRQACAAKRRSDAKSLAGKMPNRTRAGVLERQQGYANVVRTNKAHELLMQRRQLASKISSPWY